MQLFFWNRPFRILQLFSSLTVVACVAQLTAQTAQKAAEIACTEESHQQGASLWSTRTIKRTGGHTLEYRRLETVDGNVQKTYER